MELRDNVWAARLDAHAAARYYQHLKDRADVLSDRIGVGLIVLSAVTAAVAGFNELRLLTVVLGMATSLLAGLHRHWRPGERVILLTLYCDHWDDRARLWDSAWVHANKGEWTGDYHRERELDARLNASRFRRDADLVYQAQVETHHAFGLPMPTRKTEFKK